MFKVESPERGATKVDFSYPSFQAVVKNQWARKDQPKIVRDATVLSLESGGGTQSFETDLQGRVGIVRIHVGRVGKPQW